MQICGQMAEVAQHKPQFPSSSSDKVYQVYMFRRNELPFCNCPAFIFGRSKKAKAEGIDPRLVPHTCKHTDVVAKRTCQWRQELPSDYRFDSTCPQCGGPVVEEGTVTYPKDPKTSVDDLIAMRNELLGIEAPDPNEVVIVDLTELRMELLKGIRK